MALWSSWILSLKVFLISTGVVSLAMVMKFSVPLIMDFAVHQVPVIWSTFHSWLTPPYLYFIINAIIITIAASSRFHQKRDADNQSSKPPPPPSDQGSDFVAISASPEFRVVASPAVYESEAEVTEVKDVVTSHLEIGDQNEDKLVIFRSAWTPPRRTNSSEIQTEFLFPVAEKPLVSAKFGHQKPVKASPEGGKESRVAKPKRNETLENTWKMITDGRHMPLTRHLTKSDTWETHSRHMDASSLALLDQSPHQMVCKSETFKDRTNYNPPPSATSSPDSAKLRKEPSLSQDELNRRVEAFIKKFNEDMRLQRQESLNQYIEMINRGTH